MIFFAHGKLLKTRSEGRQSWIRFLQNDDEDDVYDEQNPPRALISSSSF